MKVVLTVTKDTVTGEATNSPVMSKNIAEAKRSWGNSIRVICMQGNPQNIPLKDLQLFVVGEFDTETLEIKPSTEYVCSASEFIVEPNKSEDKE